MTNAEMAEYVGSYEHAPQVWEVLFKDKKLMMRFDGKEYGLTKTGERKFAFSSASVPEGEIVFVPGKDGKIKFLFSELYAARKTR